MDIPAALEEVLDISASLGLAVFLFVLGSAIAVAEVLIPSFGFLTVMSLICFVSCFVVAFKVGTACGVVFILLTIFLVPGLVILAFRRLPSSRIGKKLILSSTGKGSDPHPEEGEEETPLQEFVGKEGIAHSKLRPGGIADFEGRRVSVVAESGFIEAGARIQALQAEGNRIMVRALEHQEEPEEEA